MKIVFIVNSQIKKLSKVLGEIGSAFYQIEGVNTTILQTHHNSHAGSLAKESVERGCDYIIAVGGDGTLNEVLNGIIHASIPVNNHPVLGVLPRGSANDFVKTIGTATNAVELLEAMHSRNEQKIDIGKISFADQKGVPRYFINIASLGLGPEVVKLMTGKKKLFGSSVAYFSSIIRGFLSYKKRHVSCQADNWQWEGRLLQIAVANARYFASGICIAPEASVSDGLFHIALFGKISIKDYITNLANLKNGKKINHKEAHYFSTATLTITPQGTDSCGIEADGEYIGESPVTISVVPRAIKFIKS